MATVGLFATVMSTGCSHSDRKAPADSDTAVVAYRMVDEYVAENDIAMTVRSIVDAISVGESLDTAEYNYNGILTDGEGVPLYTDIQGNPGEWEVDVLSDNSVRIHNLYLGDLLPKDLMEYLTTALSLSKSNLCASDEYEEIIGKIKYRILRLYTLPNNIQGLFHIFTSFYPHKSYS